MLDSSAVRPKRSWRQRREAVLRLQIKDYEYSKFPIPLCQLSPSHRSLKTWLAAYALFIFSPNVSPKRSKECQYGWIAG
ncbi:hypothetical protein F5B19DRAFT_494787 [Rostrohypoxylon terebratum]|nr:hypothetical protein F5B19DRAFT_494787 [Rostrohypoxylon terebratum]